MKQPMTDSAWRKLRARRDRARETDRREAEQRLAAELQATFPELSRSECLRRAKTKIDGELP